MPAKFPKNTSSKSYVNTVPNGLLSILPKLWPLAFVPITILVVQRFGHDGANLLLGALFLYLFIQKADLRLRRLMIVLAVFSGLFETANVASGAYTYFGALASPLWISLGWAILGWWFMQLKPALEKVPFNAAFAAISIVIAAASFSNHTLGLTTAISIAGLYALSLSVKQPFAMFAFSSLFAIIAEVSGTYGRIWGYFDLNHAPVPPDLAMLALVYSVVMAFSIWISGYENAERAQSIG
ncbi:hypothetical protein HY994_04860 [Candidatus Micrarchaeota archaeon]|nr:hypothetical protein [Candidatus Micrarchaeota archaeon]